MPTPSNTHSTNTHPCGWPNPTSFHWLRPLSSPCLRDPNGKPHLLMPYTGPASWQRHWHWHWHWQRIGLRITNNGLEIKRAGKGTSTGPSQAQNVNGRFDCPGILGPHPDALLHSQYGRIIACCRERTITFANERKWTYQCRAMVERERAGEYCPDAPECAGLGVMSHNWQRDDCPLRVRSLLSLAWLWRVFLCVRWCLYK